MLSFHRLSPRRAGPLDLPLLGSAYECWSQVWKQTFTELEGRSVLHSDDFTRQDEVGALFHGYECIALFFSRQVDSSSHPSPRTTPTSRCGPKRREEAALPARQPSLGVEQHHRPPEMAPARQCVAEPSGLRLIIERFLVSDADVLVGTMRNDRR